MNGRGRQRELAVIRLLRDADVIAYRIDGVADVVALTAGEPPRLIQCKSTRRPYDHFPPADRRALLTEARKAGTEAWLCWWPKGRGVPEWIASSDWPGQLEAVA